MIETSESRKFLTTKDTKEHQGTFSETCANLGWPGMRWDEQGGERQEAGGQKSQKAEPTSHLCSSSGHVEVSLRTFNREPHDAARVSCWTRSFILQEILDHGTRVAISLNNDGTDDFAVKIQRVSRQRLVRRNVEELHKPVSIACRSPVPLAPALRPSLPHKRCRGD